MAIAVSSAGRWLVATVFLTLTPGCLHFSLVHHGPPASSELAASDLATAGDRIPDAFVAALALPRGIARAALARTVADRLADGTEDCHQRSIDSTFDTLTAWFDGCERASGKVSMRVLPEGRRDLMIFDFAAFRLGRGELEGTWVATYDGAEVVFRGAPTYHEPEPPPREAPPSRRSRHHHRTSSPSPKQGLDPFFQQLENLPEDPPPPPMMPINVPF